MSSVPRAYQSLSELRVGEEGRDFQIVNYKTHTETTQTCLEASKKLLEIQAPLIVYVSCNPATQARDLQLLSVKYQVTAIQPVDMFPHTHHIENVVQLRLKDQTNIIA